MRKQQREILNSYFCSQLIAARLAKKLTQLQMSELLAMDERSYIDLDHGKTCCSTVTLARFLIFVCDSPMNFLTGLKQTFDDVENQVA